jgi:hypothetical protein
VTEGEWLAATDPTPMLAALRVIARTDPESITERKYRLYAVGCCRIVEGQLTPLGQQGVEVAERYADGLATEHERDDVRTAVEPTVPVGWSALYAVLAPLNVSLYPHQIARWVTINVEAVGTSPQALATLLRCIFGNPFRPVLLDTAWRTDTALSLARGMYESREFSAMPILADALMDAGCDSADILTHCRGDGPHVRGCWVVDLLLVRG